MKPLTEIKHDPAPMIWAEFQNWYKEQEYSVGYEEFIELPFVFQAGVFLSFLERKQDLQIYLNEYSDVTHNGGLFLWKYVFYGTDSNDEELSLSYFYSANEALEDAVRSAFNFLQKKKEV
jgi:hypothetical protein